MEHPKLPYHHIYLSPHFDDAVLSCGGQIAQLAAAGDTVVVTTIFGGEPGRDTLSPFAASIHARPGGAEDLVRLRRAEEKQALAILGAQGRPGDYLDCIYRRDAEGQRWLYDCEEALFGPVDPAERGLAYELAQVAATLAAPDESYLFYAPLAVGNHVDHQIVRRAAQILKQAGHEVRFYEDFPYIRRDPASLELALNRSGGTSWQPLVIELGGTDLSCKIEAIVAYHSQVGVLFGETAVVASQVRTHARETGGGVYAERLWRLIPWGSGT